MDQSWDGCFLGAEVLSVKAVQTFCAALLGVENKNPHQEDALYSLAMRA